MNRGEIRKAFREQGSQAYQADLAADFFAEESAPHHLLLTPAGLGKVLIASQIAKFLVEHRQAKRILVIAPSAFCMLWRSRLEQQSLSIPVRLLYWRDFREMVADRKAEESAWPGAEVAIVPCDTARRADVRNAMAASRWDLVIVAEVQPRSRCQALGPYKEMLAAGAVDRSLLISDTPIEPPSNRADVSAPDFQITDWFGDLADWEGRAIELPPVKWRVLEYTRSEREAHVHRLLTEQLEQNRSTQDPFHFETNLLVRRAASSPYAAERTLEIIGRKLSRASLGKAQRAPEKEYGDPTEVEDVPRLSFTPEGRKSYLGFIQDTFGAVQGITADTKLACLLGLMDELADERPGRICVLCAYADTVSYLHDALTEVGAPSVAINGGLRYVERQQAMNDFVRGGGILLATPGALGEESDLNRVKHVVHYDLPRKRSQMAQIEGRFGRINRRSPCRMYALEDLSGANPDPESLGQLIGEPQGAL